MQFSWVADLASRASDIVTERFMPPPETATHAPAVSLAHGATRFSREADDVRAEPAVHECRFLEANRHLERTLREPREQITSLREQITSLKEEVDKLCAPPSTYGVYLSANEDGT